MDYHKIVDHIKSENPEFVFTGGSNLGSDISRFYNSIKFDKKKKAALVLILAGIIAVALKYKTTSGDQPRKIVRLTSLSRIHEGPEAAPSRVHTVSKKEHLELLKSMLFRLDEHKLDAIEKKMEEYDIPDFILLLSEFQKTSGNLYKKTIAKSLFKKYILSSEKYDRKYMEKLISIDKKISQFPHIKLKFRNILVYEPVFRIHTILRNYILGMYPNDRLTLFSINMLLWGFSARTLEYSENYPQLIEDLHTVTTEDRKILNYTFSPSFQWERKPDRDEYVQSFMPFFNYLKNKKYDFIDENITVDILEKHYDKLINKKITDFKKGLKERFEGKKIIGEDGNLRLPPDLLTNVLHNAGYIFATKKELEKFAKEICPELIGEKRHIGQIEKNQNMKFPTLIEFLGTYNPVDKKTGNLYPIPATSPKFLETFDIKTDMKFEGIPKDADKKRRSEIIEKNGKLIKENINFRILVRNLFIKDMNFIRNRFGYYPDEFMSYHEPMYINKIEPNILATKYYFRTESNFGKKLAIAFLIKFFNAFAADRESHFEDYKLLETEIPDVLQNGNNIFTEIPINLPGNEIDNLIINYVIGAGYSDYIFIFIIVTIIILVILLKNEIYDTIKYVFRYKIGM